MIKVSMNTIFFLLFFSAPSEAAKVPCKIKLPSIQKGCTGEGCTVVSSIEIFKDVDAVKDLQTKTVLVHLKKGMKIKAPYEFAVEVRRPGIYRSVEKKISVPGKTLVLTPLTAFEVMVNRGVGNYDVCIENEVISMALKEDAEEVEPIQTIDWIKVQLDPKTSGFLRRSDVKVISAE